MTFSILDGTNFENIWLVYFSKVNYFFVFFNLRSTQVENKAKRKFYYKKIYFNCVAGLDLISCCVLFRTRKGNWKENSLNTFYMLGPLHVIII